MKDLYFLIQKLSQLAPPFEKSKSRRIVDIVVENMYRKKYVIYNHASNNLQIEIAHNEEKLKN